jgi:hypothetical protein
MITNPTPIRELRIGLAGVNVLPFRADRDRTHNVKERRPLDQSVEESSPECERVQSSTRVAI